MNDIVNPEEILQANGYTDIAKGDVRTFNTHVRQMKGNIDAALQMFKIYMENKPSKPEGPSEHPAIAPVLQAMNKAFKGEAFKKLKLPPKGLNLNKGRGKNAGTFVITAVGGDDD